MRLISLGFFALLLSQCSAQSSLLKAVTKSERINTYEDVLLGKCTLNDLPDSTLTKICLDRGFTVIEEEESERENEDGVIVNVVVKIRLSHEEYVEAARQCIELEEGMNNMIRENPDLLKELEDEDEAADNASASTTSSTDEEIKTAPETISSSSCPMTDTSSSSSSSSSSPAFFSTSALTTATTHQTQLQEFFTEFKNKVRSDAEMLLTALVPKALQNPFKTAFKKAMSTTKGLIDVVVVKVRDGLMGFVKKVKEDFNVRRIQIEKAREKLKAEAKPV